jgi:hypothetical protein
MLLPTVVNNSTYFNKTSLIKILRISLHKRQLTTLVTFNHPKNSLQNNTCCGLRTAKRFMFSSCCVYNKYIVSLASFSLTIALIFLYFYITKTVILGEEKLPTIFDHHFGYLPYHAIIEELAKKEAIITIDDLLISIKKETSMVEYLTGTKLNMHDFIHILLNKIWQAPFLPHNPKELYDFSSVYNQMLDLLWRAYEHGNSHGTKRKFRIIIIIIQECARFKTEDPKTPKHIILASILKSLKDAKLW